MLDVPTLGRCLSNHVRPYLPSTPHTTHIHCGRTPYLQTNPPDSIQASHHHGHPQRSRRAQELRWCVPRHPAIPPSHPPIPLRTSPARVNCAHNQEDNMGEVTTNLV
jgi:hypothetical protein